MIARSLLSGALVLGLVATAQAASKPAKLKDADWRTPDPENVLVIDTNKGRVVVEIG